MKSALIRVLQQLDIVRREKVQLKHAGTANFYIDIKKAYGDPIAMRAIVKALKKRVPKNVTCIAGGGYGGLPLATALAQSMKLNLTFVREKPKAHGRYTLIDGYIPGPRDKIYIVDDVLSTGGSLRQMMKVLRKTKAQIAGCGVVVKRGEVRLGPPVTYLIEVQDLFLA